MIRLFAMRVFDLKIKAFFLFNEDLKNYGHNFKRKINRKGQFLNEYSFVVKSLSVLNSMIAVESSIFVQIFMDDN